MFKHRLLRDLSWVILSPPLVSGKHNDVIWWDHDSCIKEYHACLPALKALDENPQPLIAYLDSLKAKGLGHYFEALVKFWINISPNYKLLAHNIQIIIKRQTLGEIDFIIEEIQSKKVIHLEVAVKFYLGSPPYQDSFRWYGTNINDQLGRKIQHLKEKQTQLAWHHKDYLLNKLGLEIDEKQCLLKGRLFYPLGIDEPPTEVTSNHLRGRWLRQSGKAQEKCYYPLDKTYWLATLNHTDINEELLDTKLKENKWPRCYSKMEKEESGMYKEKNRLFYLPEIFRFPD